MSSRNAPDELSASIGAAAATARATPSSRNAPDELSASIALGGVTSDSASAVLGYEGSVHRSFMLASPVGLVFVAHCNRRVSGLLIAEGRDRSSGYRDFARYMECAVGVGVEIDPAPDPCWVASISRALAEGRTDVPVDLSSRSSFQQQALLAVMSIPRGEVRTYTEVADIVGRPKAARAVGTAMARNPVPLLVPCHRVVPVVGGVGSYAYGPALKRRLLMREGVVV